MAQFNRQLLSCNRSVLYTAQTYIVAFEIEHYFKSIFRLIAFQKVQTTINQRLKFLLDHFGMSARSFSRAIGVADNNTQNYLGPTPALPKADYLEKVVLHFKSINPAWLLSGEGIPFLDVEEPTTNVSVKKPKGQVIGVNNGTANYQTLADCEKDLATVRREVEQLKEQLAAKEALLAAKDDLIAAKEEMLTLLRGSHNRPN